jgi:chemotaxis protein methyltransferase WspC
MSDPTVRRWLMEHTPLEPTLLEGAGFDALVAERVATVARGDASAYIDALASSPDEVERLAADIAVPETWLFRYPNSFTLLVDVLRRRAADAPLRMCSIGCATGPEPYCMAMAAVHAGCSPEYVRIDALDRNPEALAIAAAGAYGAASIRGEIPAWATEFLGRETGTIRIDARIRGLVRFVRVDVTAAALGGTYDVIFCRNVLIYLNSGARTRLVQEICAALTPGGVLFVGHAEQFIRAEPLLRPIAAPHAFALQRTEGPVAPGAAQRTCPAPPGKRETPALLPTPARPSPRPSTGTPVRPAPAVRPGPSAGSDLGAARELADAGRMAESEAMVRSLIARRGPSAAALELLGLIRTSENDATGAKRLFEQAVYLEPDRAACLLQLAMLSERAGEAQRASMYWDRAHRASATRETRT